MCTTELINCNNPIQKSQCFYVQGTRTTLTSVLAYKKIRHSCSTPSTFTTAATTLCSTAAWTYTLITCKKGVTSIGYNWFYLYHAVSTPLTWPVKWYECWILTPQKCDLLCLLLPPTVMSQCADHKLENTSTTLQWAEKQLSFVDMNVHLCNVDLNVNLIFVCVSHNEMHKWSKGADTEGKVGSGILKLKSDWCLRGAINYSIISCQEKQ